MSADIKYCDYCDRDIEEDDELVEVDHLDFCSEECAEAWEKEQ